MVRALLALALLCLPTAAHAWSTLGHRIVCEIAYAELTPTAKAEVDRLMAMDNEFKTFGESCSWADEVKPRRAEEHYVNVPRDFRGFIKVECPLADKCLLSAIRDDGAVLHSKTATDHEKLEALKFLGHWVGDIHQPLHVSFQDDRGGNEIKVTGECRGSLHSAWDGCVVEGALDFFRFQFGQALADEDIEHAFVSRVVEAAGDIRDTPSTPPYNWANASLGLVRLSFVKYCFQSPSGCRYTADNETFEKGEARRRVKVDRTYTTILSPFVWAMLSTGGVRLAQLLNDIFDPEYPGAE